MNKFIILIGMSCSGKTTMLNKLCKEKDIFNIVSYTTRPKREGERDGVDYWFIDDILFDYLDKHNDFATSTSYETLVNNEKAIWKYGVPSILNKKERIVALDIKGAKQFIEHFGKENCDVFYIDTPIDIICERAKKRNGYDKIEFERRLKDDLKVFTDEALNEIGAIKIKGLT